MDVSSIQAQREACGTDDRDVHEADEAQYALQAGLVTIEHRPGPRAMFWRM
jgi:hypothetical protein